ncbi:MAG: HEAT repeat domain-containing protein [Eudoraea sp.]|nr:HEAT repeat domain-containing protein [Eudoraea sp.]
MTFYDLTKEERQKLGNKIKEDILNELEKAGTKIIMAYFSDEDTYIRKTAYLSIGKIYNSHERLRAKILITLAALLTSENHSVRQTVINAAGEIGVQNFDGVRNLFDSGLFDDHHTVRNAVIGSIKKMAAKNPGPVLKWAQHYLHHPDKEIRREIWHGIELRGRSHPQDIVPLLRELQFDTTARVRNTLLHVLGQIAYKKDCLATVISELNQWENKELVKKAVDGIIVVHRCYEKFSAMTQDEAIEYIDENLDELP